MSARHGGSPTQGGPRGAGGGGGHDSGGHVVDVEVFAITGISG